MSNEMLPTTEFPVESGLEAIVLGGGCFWCIEAIFNQMKGVVSAESGYSGGWVERPTYEQVCDKKTGHAEVVKVIFDPLVITLDEIIEVFFEIHDPTTPDRQGNDIGPQYRSVVFYRDNRQKNAAEAAISKLETINSNKIVTEITPYSNFYKAESSHQGYYFMHTNQPYCSAVIAPKIRKFQKKYFDKLR